MVEQGNGYRSPLRPRRRGPNRTRRRVVDRAHRRRRARRRRSPLRFGPAPRPHDAERLSAGDVLLAGVRMGRRRGGDVPRRHTSPAFDDPPWRGRAGGPRGCERSPWPCPRRGGDRLPPCPVRRAWPGPHRRRADDVRAGELRALPPQDLQCLVDHRRRRDRAFAVPDDPSHPGAASGRGAVGIPRQRGGHARARCELVRSRSGFPALRVPAGAGRDPDEGGDPQSPDRDLALPGCRHRLRRRDPRRGRNRARCPHQGGSRRVLGLESADSGLRPALGARPRPAAAHCLRPRDHARRPDWRCRVQQRVRPPRPGGILPHPRARRREARRGA